MENPMAAPEMSPQEMAAQQAANAPESLELTPHEKAFMERANMTAEQLAQYNRWKKLDQELGGDQAL